MGNNAVERGPEVRFAETQTTEGQTVHIQQLSYLLCVNQITPPFSNMSGPLSSIFKKRKYSYWGY